MPVYINMINKEFDYEKELIELAHFYKIEELELEFKLRKEIEELKHRMDLETQRIKSADIKKTIIGRRFV